MKYLYSILRILLGLLFIFSGYVKGIDPWGTAIKFDEYFEAMGLSIPYTLSFIFSNFLIFFELLVGYLLTFNVQTKWASRSSFLLMLLFTPLTLWLAITGKVKDCGCFGDALKITDWETFIKNIFLLSFAIFVLLFSRKFPAKTSIRKQRLLFVLGALFSFGIIYTSNTNLPLIDFRPFKVGTDIKKDSETPENAPIAEYQTTLKYEKNGKIQEFTQDNYPWQDTTWHFVSSEQKLIKEGYTPPIHDFIIENIETGDYETQTILEDENCLLIISHKIEETDFIEQYKKTALQKVVQEANAKNTPVYLLTASMPEQVENISTYIPEKINYCFGDEKMLKTFIRANPGVVLLNKGIVIKKWNAKNLPQEINFTHEEVIKNPEIFKQNFYNNQIYFSLLLLFIITLITLGILRIRIRKKR